MADRNYKQVAFDVLVAIATSEDEYVHDRTAAAKLILEFGVYPEADDFALSTCSCGPNEACAACPKAVT